MYIYNSKAIPNSKDQLLFQPDVQNDDHHRSMAPSTTRTISCKAYNSHMEYYSWEYTFDVKGSKGIVCDLVFLKEGPGVDTSSGVNHRKSKNTLFQEE